MGFCIFLHYVLCLCSQNSIFESHCFTSDLLSFSSINTKERQNCLTQTKSLTLTQTSLTKERGWQVVACRPAGLHGWRAGGLQGCRPAFLHDCWPVWQPKSLLHTTGKTHTPRSHSPCIAQPLPCTAPALTSHALAAAALTTSALTATVWTPASLVCTVSEAPSNKAQLGNAHSQQVHIAFV